MLIKVNFDFQHVTGRDSGVMRKYRKLENHWEVDQTRAIR